ncbi:MAG: alpha/beta hydrolase [Chloroflexi bacterium]|nr:alpha/beta hydrolase [Chloroflexota bacterium]
MTTQPQQIPAGKFGPLGWARGYLRRTEGEVPGTQIAEYRLSDLVNKGYISPATGRGLLIEAGLVDMAWEVTWADDKVTDDEQLEVMCEAVEGYVVFLHGWTGNHLIFESIPGLVVTQNPRLIAISFDHNGFGESRFVDTTPALELCNPPAAMKTIELLVDVLKLRRQPGQRNLKVINFVGHSMGGATLFYLNPLNWRYGEETRLALAPALLLDDEVNRIFFTALGIGISIVNRIRAFEIIERAIKPQMIDTVCSGGSYHLRRIHTAQYQATPRGITAATFLAMGVLNNREIARRWDLFRVMLGHRDSLVGLTPMMDLLSQLEFPAAHVRVVAGSHYMFSVGPEAVFQHAQNRELVVQDILTLHQQAYELQRTGPRIGRR